MNTSAAVAFAAAFLFLSSGSADAQFWFAPEPVEPTISSKCAYTFGSENFRWCVSENGNIVDLTSPGGAEHIRVGNVSEGYVVCSSSAEPYYDVATADAGWEPATVAEAGADVDLAIERTTTDGRFTLRQDFAGDTRGRSISVIMTLTSNLEAAAAVQILRHADIDMDNTFGNDVFDKSADATWARQVHAVTLRAEDVDVPHATQISLNATPRTCTPEPAFGLPAVDANRSVSVRYDLGDVAAGESRTVTFSYRVQ